MATQREKQTQQSVNNDLLRGSCIGSDNYAAGNSKQNISTMKSAVLRNAAGAVFETCVIGTSDAMPVRSGPILPGEIAR